MTTIQIPTPLRRFTGEAGDVEVQGGTVDEALGDLTRRYPGLKPHLYTAEGALRSFVNVFLNDDDVRHLDRGATKVGPGDTLTIIPSIAGGSAVASPPQQPATPATEPADLPALTPEEIRQYSRHLIMPEVGIEGQRRLKAAKVLMIGAGGLGSPLGLYPGAGAGSSTATSSTRAISTAKCCSAMPTSAGRSSPPRSSGCAASTPTSPCSRTR